MMVCYVIQCAKGDEPGGGSAGGSSCSLPSPTHLVQPVVVIVAMHKTIAKAWCRTNRRWDAACVLVGKNKKGRRRESAASRKHTLEQAQQLGLASVGDQGLLPGDFLHHRVEVRSVPRQGSLTQHVHTHTHTHSLAHTLTNPLPCAGGGEALRLVQVEQGDGLGAVGTAFCVLQHNTLGRRSPGERARACGASRKAVLPGGW